MADCIFCQCEPATTRVYSDGYVLPCCADCEKVWHIGEGAAEALWERLVQREPQLERLLASSPLPVALLPVIAST
jgi:hypothetical protein